MPEKALKMFLKINVFYPQLNELIQFLMSVKYLWMKQLWAVLHHELRCPELKFHYDPFTYFYRPHNRNGILHMPRQHCCHGMCKITLWFSCFNLRITNQYLKYPQLWSPSTITYLVKHYMAVEGSWF